MSFTDLMVNILKLRWQVMWLSSIRTSNGHCQSADYGCIKFIEDEEAHLLLEKKHVHH